MPAAMGQDVTVVEKPSSNPEVLRFEINRSLTGQGHERYRSLDDVVRDRPVDRIARSLLQHGSVDAVHVNSSVITVDLAGGRTGEGLAELIASMFRFYPDQDDASPAAEEPVAEAPPVEEPAVEEPVAEEEPAVEEPVDAEDEQA